MPKNFQTSQYDEPIAFDGYLDVDVGRARPCGSRSSARTWRRTPASRCTSAARPAGSTAPSTRCWTTTGPACRWSRSSPSRSTAPARWRRWSPRRTSPRCATAASLGVSDVRMEQGSLRCDANLSLTPEPAARCSAPAPRPRTSTRCARWSGRCATRSAGRPPCSTAGGRIKQETRHFARVHRHHRVGPVARRQPRTTATSRSPTWCRWRPTRSGSSRSGPPLPELPVARGGPGCRRTGASPTRRCATWSTPAPSSWSRRPSRPARRRPTAASGGWASYLGSRPTRSGVELAELPITPAQLAEVIGLVAAGALNDKLARQVVDGVLAGEGSPDEVVAARGLAVVSDDGALQAAIDEALAAQPRRRREDPRRQGRRPSARSSAR